MLKDRDYGAAELDINENVLNSDLSNTFDRKIDNGEITARNFGSEAAKISDTATMLNNVYRGIKNSDNVCFVAMFYPLGDKNNKIGDFKQGLIYQVGEIFEYFEELIGKDKLKMEIIFVLKENQINNMKTNVSMLKYHSRIRNFQYFSFKEMLLNPVIHSMNQRMVLLTEDEVAEELKQLGVDRKKLSLKSKNDPPIKHFGWPKGSVVKIYRVDSQVKTIYPESIGLALIK